uniref:Uncharacterized protein n=1 Tax=Stegastes partitus TaxID=144197 RepID=A0A3B5B0W6_9TELE
MSVFVDDTRRFVILGPGVVTGSHAVEPHRVSPRNSTRYLFGIRFLFFSFQLPVGQQNILVGFTETFGFGLRSDPFWVLNRTCAVFTAQTQFSPTV